MRYPLTGTMWMFLGMCLFVGGLIGRDVGLIASALVIGAPLIWYGRRLYRGRPLFPGLAGMQGRVPTRNASN